MGGAIRKRRYHLGINIQVNATGIGEDFLYLKPRDKTHASIASNIKVEVEGFLSNLASGDAVAINTVW